MKTKIVKVTMDFQITVHYDT